MVGRGHRAPGSSMRPRGRPQAPTRPGPARPPPRWPMGGALVGGELVALAVQVGKLSVGTKVKGNLLLQVPGRGGQAGKGQPGRPEPHSGQHRKAHSSRGGPRGGRTVWGSPLLPPSRGHYSAEVARATPHYHLLRGARQEVALETSQPCYGQMHPPLT